MNDVINQAADVHASPEAIRYMVKNLDLNKEVLKKALWDAADQIERQQTSFTALMEAAQSIQTQAGEMQAMVEQRDALITSLQAENAQYHVRETERQAAEQAANEARMNAEYQPKHMAETIKPEPDADVQRPTWGTKANGAFVADMTGEDGYEGTTAEGFREPETAPAENMEAPKTIPLPDVVGENFAFVGNALELNEHTPQAIRDVVNGLMEELDTLDLSEEEKQERMNAALQERFGGNN